VRGFRIASRTIAGVLSRYDFTDDPPLHRRYAVRSVHIPLWNGRLIQYVPEAYRDRYSGESKDLEDVVERDGSPYRHWINSPVLMVGDSFVRYNPDAGSDLAAHLSKELDFPVATAILYGMQISQVPRLLARDKSFLEGKRVVIW
jgi:hypothetical protein